MTLNLVEKNSLLNNDNYESIYCTDQVSSFFAYPKNKRFHLNKNKIGAENKSKLITTKSDAKNRNKRKKENQYSLANGFYKNSGQSFSKYKLKLIENRKIRLLYGNLSKNAIKKLKIFTNAKKSCMLTVLESRLDIILYRAAFFDTIASARQMIRSGGITVNNKKIFSSAYLVFPGDIVNVCFSQDKNKKQYKDAASPLRIGCSLLDKIQNKQHYQANTTGLFDEHNLVQNDVTQILNYCFNNRKQNLQPYKAKPFINTTFKQKKVNKSDKQLTFSDGNENNSLLSRNVNQFKNEKKLFCLAHKKYFLNLKQKLFFKYDRIFKKFNCSNTVKFITARDINKQIPKDLWLTKTISKSQTSQLMFSKHINKKFKNKMVKPQHLEISLRSLSIVFLFRPQHLYFNHFIDFNLLLK